MPRSICEIRESQEAREYGDRESHHFSSSATYPARTIPWLIHSHALLTQPPIAMLLPTQTASQVFHAAGRITAI